MGIEITYGGSEAGGSEVSSRKPDDSADTSSGTMTSKSDADIGNDEDDAPPEQDIDEERPRQKQKMSEAQIDRNLKEAVEEYKKRKDADGEDQEDDSRFDDQQSKTDPERAKQLRSEQENPEYDTSLKLSEPAKLLLSPENFGDEYGHLLQEELTDLTRITNLDTQREHLSESEYESRFLEIYGMATERAQERINAVRTQVLDQHPMKHDIYALAQQFERDGIEIPIAQMEMIALQANKYNNAVELLDKYEQRQKAESDKKTWEETTRKTREATIREIERKEKAFVEGAGKKAGNGERVLSKEERKALKAMGVSKEAYLKYGDMKTSKK